MKGGSVQEEREGLFYYTLTFCYTPFFASQPGRSGRALPTYLLTFAGSKHSNNMTYNSLKRKFLIVWEEKYPPREVKLNNTTAHKVLFRSKKHRRFVIQKMEYRRIKWEY